MKIESVYYKWEKRVAELAIAPYERKLEELRYNHYHDPDNGRFTSGNYSGKTFTPDIRKRYSDGGSKSIDKAKNSDIIANKKYDTSALNSSNIEISSHAVERAAERGITKLDIIDAIDRPLDEKPVKRDGEGRPSFQRIGENATAAINPENRKLTSTWKTHTKLKNKLKGKRCK